jgi:ParB family transcriptional regulator, chromosome partitioning protein
MLKMNAKKQALGRGLSSLLPDFNGDINSLDNVGRFLAGSIANIPISLIESNPFQPRTLFEEESINELAESIRHQGIIQPITVRRVDNDKFQLIAGERRLRASQIAGLTEIPSYIRLVDDQQLLEMALVENIQRENLNSIEIAISFQRLIEECNLTQEKLSERLGKDRSTITNYIRLLKLPPEIQIAIRDNKISMGHARALISIENHKDQLKLLGEIISKHLSVRAVEEIVRKINEKKKPKVIPVTLAGIAAKYLSVKQRLSNKFNTGITIKRDNKGKGSIVIPFKSDEELDQIIKILDKH